MSVFGMIALRKDTFPYILYQGLALTSLTQGK